MWKQEKMRAFERLWDSEIQLLDFFVLLPVDVKRKKVCNVQFVKKSSFEVKITARERDNKKQNNEEICRNGYEICQSALHVLVLMPVYCSPPAFIQIFYSQNLNINVYLNIWTIFLIFFKMSSIASLIHSSSIFL